MIAKPVLNTAPATMAVSLAEMKEYLRVDSSAEDAEITRLTNGAIKRLEALSDRKFVSQKWDIYFDSFGMTYDQQPWWDGVRDGAISQLISPMNKIVMPFGPLISLQSMSTFDDTDTEFVTDAATYNVDTVSPRGAIVLKIGEVWPTTILRTVNGIKVKGTFGFSVVPDDIQEAVKILTAAMYENRGDELPKIPAQAALLIEPYRRVKVGC